MSNLCRLSSIKFLLFITFSTMFLAEGLIAAGPRSTVRKGVDYYNSEEYDKALAEFLAGMQEAPDRDELSYDVGTAFYKLQKYPEAMSAFSKSIEGQNPDVASDAWYNLGNSLANDNKLEDALGAYINALKLNHDDMDAKFNLETVRRLMQMQQQQQQQQQEGGESDSTQQQKDQEQQQAEKQEGEGEKSEPEKSDEEKEEEQQAQNEQDSDGEPQDSTGQPQPEKMTDMTEEEAQQLLQAMQGDELEALKEKLRRQFGEPKRVEKDW